MDFKVSLAVAVVALGACTDPATLGSGDDPNKNAKDGALIGAIVGTGIGLATAGGDKGKSALIGAAAGAAAGGLIGNELDKQAAELRNNLANDGISITNTGDSLVVSLPQDITFDTDSFTVRPSLQSDLGTVAAHLLKYPDSTVRVVGHTDSEGDASYNLGLSQRRANAVADILQSDGVPYSRLQTSGRGEEQPVASNLTEEGRAQNRRVEIIVVPYAS
ncbi:MAG: OmpA family protein [Rhodobacteraceae bacterium]|nr:OmpA family protein [Paracoccaceae bacterium]